MDKLNDYLSLLRLSHWSKAIFVLIGSIYSANRGYFMPASLAALAFCLIASAVYIYNDILDRYEDRLHPHKKLRPLANSRVSLFDALLMLILLLVTGFVLAMLVSHQLVIILFIYLIINLAYNHLFKFIPVMDVLCIASGFLLRVLAGTLGIGLSASLWLVVAATLLSLFIALNKRRLEIRLGLKHSTRKVLQKYSSLLLRRLIVGVGNACFAVYFFYTVYARGESFYFMLTVPFAAIALWRFAWLSNRPVASDDPVNVFLNDRLSRINLWCFAILTFMALTRSG